ncbi:SDR family oxidoreductase [Corynebacterium freneyi]|uniref:NAD(P)-dependent dehydrogenase (Short-subunit alcohol dehydrogenase family) n=1 Tax=Corynebacterium freneyi TaxID=134034 RepID=A0ABS4U3T3_9CORY|nr:NAD(P)-dependent dehydrogenase (short-subunit alcohol dehydrogenase family) [Corynebacterium freneyi]WJZ04059.1 3-oxoacyl-[acyl-carrier-protein] reductase FabG [Corynebacterium freneyi]
MGASETGASGADSNRGGANGGDATAAQRAGGRPIALITGASRGIGRAIARDLGHDHHVLVGSTTPEGAAAVVAELPSAEPFAADVTDPEALAAAIDAAGLGGEVGIDVLVHSAGIWAKSNVADADRDEWSRLLDVNVVSVVDLTRRLLPALRRARGTVVAINSGSGYKSGPGLGLYSASKFALRAVTDALREEERDRVRVSSVHPGRVDTDMQVQIMGADGYDGTKYVHVDSIAAAVRLCVDATEDCIVEEVTVRPRK